MFRRSTQYFSPPSCVATSASASTAVTTRFSSSVSFSLARFSSSRFSPSPSSSSSFSVSSSKHFPHQLLSPVFTSSLRFHSTADKGTPHPWIDGELRPEYSSKHDRKKLNPQTLPHHFQAKIQNDRRDMGMPEIVDWEAFAEDAIYIPTKSGPLWVGGDDPRSQQWMRRKEKYKMKPAQITRADPGKDATITLEDHPLRPYYSEPSDLNDPMSIADGLYKAGMIKSYDIKYTASRIEYKPRPPIVTVMGHVDHGKTSILDYLRRSNVAAQEAGGITQSVGAFSVRVRDLIARANGVPVLNSSSSSSSSSNSSDNNTLVAGEDDFITFIDTPGHKAFTEMRQVGARCTDIIILVISAVDGIQPQTIEALEIAQKERIPFVIAANKIDREPNIEPLKKGLRDRGIELEDDGGDVQLCKVSAITGEGLPELLEAVQLQAAMSELSTPVPSRAEISVIESRSPDATEVVGVVKCGLVKPGMTFAAGVCYATVTKVCNEQGDAQRASLGLGVSRPVILSGFKMMPKPGSTLFQLSSEVHGERYYELMREVYKVEGKREAYLQTLSAETRGQFYNRKPNNDTPRVYDAVPINMFCYAATFGQLQAMMSLLYALPSIDGVHLSIKGAEVGGPDDHAVMLLTGIQQPGVVLVFGSVQDKNHMSFPSRVDVFRFDVVYHGIEWLKKRMVSSLPKKKCERILSTSVCKQVFRASQAGKGNAAGLLVQKGTLHENQTIIVLRAEKKRKSSSSSSSQRKTTVDDEEEPIPERIYSGTIRELRRFKDIVPSVDQNLECGLILHGDFTFKSGDIIHNVEHYEEEHDVEAIFEAAEDRERIARETAMRYEESNQSELDSKLEEFRKN